MFKPITYSHFFLKTAPCITQPIIPPAESNL